MEPILLASGFLLYNQLKNKDKTNNTLGNLPSGKAPWIYSDDDTGQVQRKIEYTKTEAPMAYQPSWMRQFNIETPREVVETIHPADEMDLELENPYVRFRRGMNDTVKQVIGTRTAGEGLWEDEPIQVRPPRIGGYDGYDEERGTKPIPRYFRYDLGEDLTVNEMKDSGMTKGFAYGKAGKSSFPGNFEIQPDRDIQFSSTHRGIVPGNVESKLGIRSNLFSQERPQTDTHGLGRGLGHQREKPYMKAQHDPLDKRFREEYVPSHNVTGGVSKVGSVYKGGSMMDKNITRQSQIPAADLERPFDKTKGLSLNPIQKNNYLQKGKDYLQQPNQQHVDTLSNASGVSRFTKLHSSSSTLVKDSTQWNYTVDLKNIHSLLDSNANMRKTREAQSLANAHRVGINTDKQLARLDIKALDFTGLDRTNRGIPSTASTMEINDPVSSDKQLARISVDTYDPKLQVSNQKPVLFSEEERNDYKLDPKLLLETDLQGAAKTTQGLSAFRGASSHTPMSNQYALTEQKPLNSSLRQNTSYEKSTLYTGGSERIPLTNKKVQSNFQSANAVFTTPRLTSISDPVFTTSKGINKDGIGQHPVKDQSSVLLSLTADKRDGTRNNNMSFGKKSNKPSDNVSIRFENVKGNNPAILFDNDEIAERGGRLTLPEGAGRRTHSLVQLDPGRESLQQKPARLQRKR